MQTSELSIIENELISQQARLQNSIDLLFKDKSRHGDGLTQDLDDQSVIIENDQVIDDLDRINRNKLRSVEHALSRIKAGSYGFCEVCGDDIHPKRLMAIPSTNKCMSCSEDERVL